MKQLLIAVNSKYIHSSLAVWYLQAVVPCSSVLEFTINQPINATIDTILKEKPDFIGFSCYIWNILYVRKVAQAVRDALPDCTIVFGGPEVSYCPQNHLDLADYVVCGYGERVLPRLIAALDAHTPTERILYGAVGDIPPSPYTAEYLGSLSGRIVYLETSRGCPFSCAFCLSGVDELPVFFPLERAKADILRLSQSGAQTIKFVDRTFNANAQRATELWRFILENPAIPANICFHFEIGADLLTPEQLRLLQSAPVGRFQLEIGLQSFYEPTLLAVQRKTSVDKLVDNIGGVVDNSNIHVHIDLIVGLPYETFAQFRHSFNRAFALGANMVQVGFLKLLYGSKLRKDAETYQMVYQAEPPYEIISLDCMSRKEIASLKDFEDMVERLHNSGRFTSTVSFLLHATKQTPFDLFFTLSQQLHYAAGCSLDTFTTLLYERYMALPGLRDALVIDRLTFDNSGVLPPCLKIADPRLRRVKAEINQRYPLKRGVRRSVALLYTTNTAIFCDYQQANPVTGHYQIQYIEVTE